MSNTKHTPTPWFAKRDGWSTVYIEARIRPGVLQEVAACGPTEGGTDEQGGNATFIVRACNAHYDLLTLLEEAARYLRHDPQTDLELVSRIETKAAELRAEA